MIRQFFPGSEWIYIKLYTNEINANSIICKIAEALESDREIHTCIKKWFYIRYADPDSHIRLRILQQDMCSLFKIISFINHTLEYEIRNSIVWKIQLDTYERELDRYGEKNIELSETIFCIESYFISQLLHFKEEILFVYTAVWCIEKYLNGLNFSLSEKIDILQDLSDSFNREFHVNTKSINRICQEYKHTIEKIIEGTFTDEQWEGIQTILNPFISSQIPNLQTIKTHKVTKYALSSHIHMLNNRLFTGDNRKYELIIYNLLFKYYKSKEIRNKISQ